MGVHHNSWGSTGSVIIFMLSFLFYFLFVIIPAFCPSLWRLPAVAVAAVCRWNTMSNTAGQETVAAAAIPRLILWPVRFFIGRSSVGDGDIFIEAAVAVLSGTLSTFSGVFLPIIPDIVLLRLQFHCPCRPVYLFLSLSSVALVIPHLFYCPHCLSSLPHLWQFCLDYPAYPLPYPLTSLSSIPGILHFWFPCNYQPDSPLHFSSSVFSIILHLCLRRPCYPTSLYSFCFWYLRRPASLPLPLSLPDTLLRPALLLLLRAATNDLRRRVPVGQIFLFKSGGLCCPSSRVTARHRLGLPIFRFGRPRHPQPCDFRLWDATFFSLGQHICSAWGHRISLQAVTVCFLLRSAHGKIFLGAPCSDRADGCAVHLVLLGTTFFYILEPPPPPPRTLMFVSRVISTSAHPCCDAYMPSWLSKTSISAFLQIFCCRPTSAAAVFDFLYLHFWCLRCPTSTPLRLSATAPVRHCPRSLSFSSIPSSNISTPVVIIVFPRLFCSPHRTIFHHSCSLTPTFFSQGPSFQACLRRQCSFRSCVLTASILITPVITSALFPIIPNLWWPPFHILCCRVLFSRIPNSIIIIHAAVFPSQVSILRPFENLGILSMLLRATSLFPTISCACNSNFSPLISACSNLLSSFLLLAPIYFACSNPL